MRWHRPAWIAEVLRWASCCRCAASCSGDTRRGRLTTKISDCRAVPNRGIGRMKGGCEDTCCCKKASIHYRPQDRTHRGCVCFRRRASSAKASPNPKIHPPHNVESANSSYSANQNQWAFARQSLKSKWAPGTTIRRRTSGMCTAKRFIDPLDSSA